MKSGIWWEKHSVSIALLYEKIIGFVLNWALMNYLSNKIFQNYSLALSIFTVAVPFTGLGLYYGLLRYGSSMKEDTEKQNFMQNLFRATWRNQIWESLLFGCLLYLFFSLHSQQNPYFLLIAFCVRFLGYGFYNFTDSWLRASHNNPRFSLLRISVVSLNGFGSLYFLFQNNWDVFLWIQMLSPFIALFFLRPEFFTSLKITQTIQKDLLSYSLFTGWNNIASSLLFSIDILLITYLSSAEDLKIYRAAILIPSNMVFLGTIQIQRDFPLLAKNYLSKRFQRIYYRKFMSQYFLILIGGFIGSLFLAKPILSWLFPGFGSNLYWNFMILYIGFAVSFLFRIPLAHILSAMGKAKWMLGISLATSAFCLFLGIFMVPYCGSIGMSSCMSGSLIFSAGVYYYYYKKCTS